MTKEEFALRLAKLRQARGVSARDMGLSMGQSPGYISNIESGKSAPSMTGFFYICDYLHITPQEFFAEEVAEPAWLQALLDAARRLDRDKLEHLTAIARYMK